MFSDIDYCCLNSTYLEVRGSGCFDTWQDVAAYRDSCHWTDWSPHTCFKEMMTVSRLCRVTDCDDDLTYSHTYRQTDTALFHEG